MFHKINHRGGGFIAIGEFQMVLAKPVIAVLLVVAVGVGSVVHPVVAGQSVSAQPPVGGIRIGRVLVVKAVNVRANGADDRIRDN